MGALEAAEQLLREADGPLHYKEITERILASGAWTSNGRTPEATVNALIGSDIKRLGRASTFRRVTPGVFCINSDGRPLPELPSEDEGPDKLTFLDAAEHILSTSAAGEPMHYVDITNRALELGVLNTTGRTPDATMYAQIVTDVNKASASGGVSRFTKLGKGMVGLTEWQGIGINLSIDEHNREVRSVLRSRLLEMDPEAFEHLVEQVLAEMGFEELQVTPFGGDKGVDVRGTLRIAGAIPVKMAVQAKKWKNNVQAPEVQKIRGAAAADEHPLIITTSDFSKGAYEEAARSGFAPVGLINGRGLVDLMVAHGLGVVRDRREIIDLEPGNVQAQLDI